MVIRRTSLKKIHTEERRLQILDAALSVFARRGFANTTVKDTAHAANISIGLIYNYFSGKEQLLEAIAERYSFLPQLRETIKGAEEKPCRESLRNIALGFIRLLEQKDLIIRIYLQESHSNTKVQQIWSSLVRESVSLLQEHLSARIKTGELKYHNAEVSARCLFHVLIMFHLTRGYFRASKITKSQFVDEMLDNVFQGIQSPNKLHNWRG